MTSNHHELAKVSDTQPPLRADRKYLSLWFALARRPWRSLVLVPGLPGGSAAEAARALAEVGQKVSGHPVRAVTMSTLDYGTALALSDLQDQIRRLASELGRAPQAIEVTPHHEVGVEAHHGQGHEHGHGHEHGQDHGHDRHGPGEPHHPGQDGAEPELDYVHLPSGGRGRPRGPAVPSGPEVEAEHAPGDQTKAEWDRERASADSFLGESVLTPTAARFIISIPCLLSEPLGLAATQSADAVVIVIEVGRTRMADVQRIVAQVGRERVAGTILVR